jgi:hypothetical protein
MPKSLAIYTQACGKIRINGRLDGQSRCYSLSGIDRLIDFHDDSSMTGLRENRKRMRQLIRRTMLAVRKSNQRIQETNELLMHSYAASAQIKIKRPDAPMQPELSRTD